MYQGANKFLPISKSCKQLTSPKLPGAQHEHGDRRKAECWLSLLPYPLQQEHTQFV